MPTPLAFIDVETTGLERPSSPTPGEVWEVAAIVRREDDLGRPFEARHTWLLYVDLDHADDKSLEISGFIHRHPGGADFDPRQHPGGTVLVTAEQFVAEFGLMVEGCHWIGNVPSFDEERIAALFHAQGHTGDMPWHYHLIDIESMIAGHVHRKAVELHRLDQDSSAAHTRTLGTPPWDSEDLSRTIGVDPAAFERHTAMGDAEWVRAQFDAMTTGGR